jgi:Na+/alanine symporter
MQEFEKLIGQLSDFVWGPPLLILLLGTHIFSDVSSSIHPAISREGD